VAVTFTLRQILGEAQAEAIEPVRECPTGKVAYLSKAEADRALARLHRQQTRMRRFRCPYCEAWHLGHRRGTI
jgi:hypothetical protein